MSAIRDELRSLRSGPACLLEGYRLLLQPGLRRFVVLPALGNIVLFLLAAALLFWGLDSAIERWLPESVGWLRWLILPVAALLLLLGGMFAFALLANLLLGPFLDVLAAKVQLRLGRTVATSNSSWWLELRAGLALELRRIGYVLVCLAGVFVLGLIPVLNLAAAPLGVLVGGWLLAVECAGHPLGLARMNLAEQLQVLRLHRWAVLAFGLSCLGALMVPVLNLLLLPASVAGMTLFLHERLPRDTASKA